jgi:hypothetical protein
MLAIALLRDLFTCQEIRLWLQIKILAVILCIYFSEPWYLVLCIAVCNLRTQVKNLLYRDSASIVTATDTGTSRDSGLRPQKLKKTNVKQNLRVR